MVGTTDIAVDKSELEPIAQVEEINFILETLNRYSKRQINYQDIRSVFCGQRPLVKPLDSKDTSKISRKHEIFTSGNGLVTIVGGKWTIYRLMGEDTINYLEKYFSLPATKSRTKQLKLFGYSNNPAEYPLSSYGSEANKIQEIQIETGNFAKLHPRLPYFQAELIYQIRYEQAKTIEDILARRTRALLLDATAAIESAELVAQIIATELGKDINWQNNQLDLFKKFAQSYSVGYYNK